MEKINLKLYEWYFLLGLFLFTIGQFLIFIFFNAGEWRNQEPIDFAHWFLLIGVLLLIPQIGNFPKSKLNLVGTPILVLIGTLVIYIGSGSFNVLGYIVLTVGFYINFYRQPLSQNG